MYDIIIIGCGPAGMTAGIYASIARKKILIFEKSFYGGQIVNANKIKNYPGFDEISGYDYATKLYSQLKNYNPEIKFEEVLEVEDNKDFKNVKTSKGNYIAKSVIIATGAKNRKLGLNNEDKFLGKGISYCATCDGSFYKDKVVAITGGGNTAIDDALYLSNIAKEIFIIYRQKNFKIESINIDELKKKNNVKIVLNSSIIDIKGGDKLQSIIIKNNDTEEKNELYIDGLFIAIGHIPVSNIFKNIIKRDEKGYIISDENCKTNLDGIFVAGDIRKKEIRQLTTACSDGTVAALNACKFLSMKKIKNKSSH